METRRMAVGCEFGGQSVLWEPLTHIYRQRREGFLKVWAWPSLDAGHALFILSFCCMRSRRVHVRSRLLFFCDDSSRKSRVAPLFFLLKRSEVVISDDAFRESVAVLVATPNSDIGR